MVFFREFLEMLFNPSRDGRQGDAETRFGFSILVNFSVIIWH